MPDGNESQVRAIADQLGRQMFEQWKREQEADRRPLSLTSITSAAALAISAGTMIWQAAITTQRVNENTRRIEKIEAFGFDRNFARLEAKVDLLIEDRNRNLRIESAGR